MLQVMSLPQHCGDLIFPWPLGQTEMRTVLPSSLVSTSSTRSAPQWPQVVTADIPQVGQV